MKYAKDTDYSVRLTMYNGDTQELDEWFSLGVAKKIAAKAYDSRASVVGSQVQAIEVVNFEGEVIQKAEFPEEEHNV